MPKELPLRITQDPSHGFTRHPASTIRHPDLVLTLDTYAENHITARAYGTALPPSPHEYTARLDVSPTTIRTSAARLRTLWKRELVAYEPLDPATGIPVSEPYATRMDLTDEPELAEILDELAEQGAYLLWHELLGADGRGADRLRKVVQEALTSEKPLRIRVDSPLFLPWPMLALPTGVEENPLHRFLGYRHQMEQTGGRYADFPDESDPQLPPPVPVVSLNHDKNIDPYGRTRAADVATALTQGTVCVERSRRDELLTALKSGCMDDQLMYFWCHGRFEAAQDASAPLLVVSLTDGQNIDAHTVLARRTAGLLPHRPLVLFNACYAGLPGGADLTYLGGALITAGAGGVLGPQIEMPQVFAAEYAYAFVTRYLGAADTAGEIAHTLARHFADTFRNPLGFAYALHCGMDRRLERAAPVL
ncbi:CHAT domain-containing protein [Streptomyces acidiscabies]|uniref:CHAT domain-containing protein n=1 Tax=Streptomyces acidiscabies TaxID=42234 RepID=UPI00067CCD55|nr:CHAT domain-containing protein [Streptomyces acidiscabies]